jgi:hypothetical protein
MVTRKTIATTARNPMGCRGLWRDIGAVNRHSSPVKYTSDITAPTPLTSGAQRSIRARERMPRISANRSPQCENPSCAYRMSDAGNIVRDCSPGGQRSAPR